MKISTTILSALALAAGATLGHAVPLTLNSNTALPGTTVLQRPELAGAVIADVTTSPFLLNATNGVVTGDLEERVVQEAGTGTLDFYWRVFVDPRSTGTLGSVRLGQFFPSAWDADWRIDSLGDVGPDQAFLFGNGQVNFAFSQGVAAGQSSNFFFLHTDATAYTDNGLVDVADAGTFHESQDFSTFAPAVPDTGATAILFGLGLVGVALARRVQPREFAGS